MIRTPVSPKKTLAPRGPLAADPSAHARRSHTPARLAAAAAASLGLLASVSVPAAAELPVERYPYAEHVELAGAAFLSDTEFSSTTAEVRVFLTDQRTSSGFVKYTDPGIILFYTHREVDPDTGIITETNYEGFSGGEDATFEFSPALKSASADFPLTVWGYECVTLPGGDPGEPQGSVPTCETLEDAEVTAHITWTGAGPISRFADNERYDDPPYLLFGVHTVQAVRDAQVAANITGDGLVLVDGPATFAVLLQGKYHQNVVMPPTGRPTSS